jgi:hypothetical protein
VLRVPRRALEELIGVELTGADSPSVVQEIQEAVPPAEPPNPRTSEPAERRPAQRSPTTPRTPRRQNRISDQLDLFDSQPRPT